MLLGHRGARRDTRENTLPAFDLCLEHGCDGFEFDVRRTADGRAVVLHDATLDGMAVAECDFSVLQTRSRELFDEDLLRLEGVLERYSTSAFLDIELKVPGLEEAVVELVQRHSFLRGYVVSSFLPAVVEALRRRSAEVPTGFICDRSDLLPLWKSLPADVLVLHSSLISPALLADAKKEGKRVFVWTVNRPEEMRRLAEMGADGVISDDTALLCRTLGSSG